ncbi:hypothetical protein DVH24_038378 [Malus domestica]|uniref:Uncharacterized protein n=1 Tax=Malus domestica TaxID=3750 RepID=A0A498KCK8_MALDO|nr:hypothetical protein DVH24_038378 [Malus domestica]
MALLNMSSRVIEGSLKRLGVDYIDHYYLQRVDTSVPIEDTESVTYTSSLLSLLENHVEAPEEFPKKAKLFFAHAAENWNAEFYSKFNDDVYATAGIIFLLD